MSVLWATGAWGGSAPDADPATENDPAYFYEDHAASGSHLRAIGKNGLQVWQWPADETAPAFAVTSTTEYLADAGRCTPGSTLDAAKIQIDALQKLAAAQVYENHAVSTHVFEENKAHGAASTVLVKSAVPTGDITFDEGGGVATFFAVRTTTQRWRENSSAKIENFQYRITADAGVTYRFLVPGNGQHNIMILGPQGPAVVTFGNTVTAFEPETGRELWRWQSKNTDLVPYEALQDGAVAIRDGDKYTVLKDGKVQTQLDETYVRFVKMFRPPELNF